MEWTHGMRNGFGFFLFESFFLGSFSSLLCVQVHKSKANADRENLSDVETQAYAKFFADAFAQRFPEAPIQFVETWLVELSAGAMTRYATLEPFVEGTYEKYTSNCGYIADGAALAEAFSHFSYCHSGPGSLKEVCACCVLVFSLSSSAELP